MVMVEFGNERNIRKEIWETLKLITKEKDNITRLALYNYIGNLYSALSVIKGRSMYPKRKKILGDLNNYNKFVKSTDFMMDRFLDNFIKNQEFHQDCFNDLLVGIEDVFIKNISGAEYSKQSDYFGEDDFLIVFHDFCQSLGLEKIFYEIFEDKRLFKMSKGIDYDNYLGLTLHNPLTGESRILIDSFDYNLDSMFTLAHEVGHYYDLLEFFGRDKNASFVSYTFKSVFQEVFSRLFERLFLAYLINENIMRDKAIDKFLDLEIINHDYIVSSYILSLLDSEYLNKDMDMDPLKIFKMVSKFFSNAEVVEEYIGNVEFDLMSDINYAYGDFLSMFLKEEVLAEGLDSELVRKFKEIRNKEFNVDFLLREELIPERYIALYKKEVQLINQKSGKTMIKC